MKYDYSYIYINIYIYIWSFPKITIVIKQATSNLHSSFFYFMYMNMFTRLFYILNKYALLIF